MTADTESQGGAPRESAAPATLFELFNEIGIISQLSTAAFERVMPAGMSRAQFSVLNHLIRLGGPRSLVSLARSFQVTKGAITHTTSKLLEKGLISVRPDPEDGRGKLVDITPAGIEMRDACVSSLAPLLDRLVAGLPTESLTQLIPELRALRRWLDENRLS